MLLSWSGGKDAAWTLHRLRLAGVDVQGLLTTLTIGTGRASMQGIRRAILHAQAAAAGVPLLEVWIPEACDNALYEHAFASGLAVASQRWPGVDEIAFGDLFLQDIRDYRVQMLGRHGWNLRTPLFGSDTGVLACEMQAGGLQAVVCCVDTQRLAADFAGRPFDASLLRDLPARVDPCGENGEFHTCVHSGPMFSRPIRLVRGETVPGDARFACTDFELHAPSAP